MKLELSRDRAGGLELCRRASELLDRHQVGAARAGHTVAQQGQSTWHRRSQHAGSRADLVTHVGRGQVCRVCCERGSNGAERPRWRAGRSSRAAAMAERCLRRAELLLLLPMAASNHVSSTDHIHHRRRFILLREDFCLRQMPDL